VVKMVHFELIEDIEGFRSLEKVWDDIARESYTSTPFQSFCWNMDWWNSFGKDKQLMIVVMKEAEHHKESIIGIAPLAISKSFMGDMLEFIGIPLSDYADLMIRNDRSKHTQEMVRYIAGLKGRFDFINLKHIPEDSKTMAACKKIPGSMSGIMQIDRSHSIVFDESWVDFKQTLFGKNYRRSVYRLGRKFNVEYKIFEGDSLTDDTLEIFFRLHIDRWKGTASPSMFEQATYREFFKRFIKKPGFGRAFFYSLILDGKVVGMQLIFEWKGIHYMYSIVSDSDYEKHSVGTIVVKNFVMDNEVKVKAIDFTRGNESFKTQMTNQHSDIYACFIHRNPARFLLSWSIFKAEMTVKNNKFLYEKLKDLHRLKPL
jgi:CelD/BcsL family acetyltransferase involved in cellulose biosynthesis